jgi:hypothetical protein
MTTGGLGGGSDTSWQDEIMALVKKDHETGRATNPWWPTWEAWPQRYKNIIARRYLRIFGCGHLIDHFPVEDEMNEAGATMLQEEGQ